MPGNSRPQETLANFQDGPIDIESVMDDSAALNDSSQVKERRSPLAAGQGARTEKARRHRLKKTEKAFLETEYLKCANWSKDHVTQIAKRLAINRTKVYKWHWDRRKKP